MWHDSFSTQRWHTYGCVMSNIWMSHVTNWVTWLIRVWHDVFKCATWRIHMRDMAHSYVWHDAFICVTWLIHICDMTPSYVWHDSFICVTWLIHMCDMTHSCVWHDSFMCVTWLIHMCDMIHSCDMSYSNVLHMGHDSLIPGNGWQAHLEGSRCCVLQCVAVCYSVAVCCNAFSVL